MGAIAVSNVRNFAILGHNGSGKTALTDALAFKLGLNDRLGSVDNGSSISDTHDEEKTRKTSIFANPFLATYKAANGEDYRLVFIDTPGAPGFYGQVRGAIAATDSALIVVDASSGVEAGTLRAWHICKTHGIKSVAFAITGLDKENTNFDNTVAAIREHFGNGCCPLTVPAAGAVANVLDMAEVPAELEESFTALAEAAAESSEELMNKYFEEGTLSAEEIRGGLRDAVASGSIHPVYTVFPLKGDGVSEMLDSICRLLPAPGGRPFADAEGNEIKADADAPFVAQVWRTAIDTFVGQLSYVRVLAGTLKPGMAVQNATSGSKENVSSLLQVIGKKQTPIDCAVPGEIVALPKLKDTHTGDSLCADGTNVTLPAIDYPQSVMLMSVHAKTQADEDKLSTAMKRLSDSDPTLIFEKNEETKEVIMKGIGDVHIDVAVSLMKSQSNVNVVLTTPKVAYRETVTGKGEGHYRHKKQTGGHGQFGEVYLRVMAMQPGEEEWFVDSTVGGSIPGNFMPAVQKGLMEGLQKGAVAGYPVQGVKVEVYDGSFHPVDSSEVAFKIASSRAFREAMSQAKPTLLEPIMTVKITIPDSYMGAITGDLNHRRGRVLGMEMDDGMQIVTAEVPMAELFNYPAQLRSLTGSRGSFEMELARYDVVPGNITQKIVAARQDELKIEDE